MSKKKNPPGPDGLTLDQLEAQLPKHLSFLRESICQGVYKPGSYRVVTYRKKRGKKSRSLAWLNLTDKWVHRVVMDFLMELVEPILAPSCLSYRKGVGVNTASELISNWLSEGYSHYLRADIADFFPSINVKKLLDQLRRLQIPEPCVNLLGQLLNANGVDEMGHQMTLPGLPLGFPVSPVLANCYLIEFDRKAGEDGFPYLRFGDDLFFMGKSKEQLDQQLIHVEDRLCHLDLKLKSGKTRIASTRGGFSFLGRVFKEGAVFQKVPQSSKSVSTICEKEIIKDPKRDEREACEEIVNEALSGIEACQTRSVLIAEELVDFHEETLEKSGSSPSKGPHSLRSVGRQVFLRTLYLTEQGAYARTENQNIVLNLIKGQERIPLRKIDQIVILGRVNLSTALLQQCLKRQIPVVFISHKGNYVGRLESLSLKKNDLALEQMRRAEDPVFRLEIARILIRGKLHSQLDFLRSRRGIGADLKSKINRIENLEPKIEKCETIEDLLGYEGRATREYFEVYGKCFIEEVNFSGRNRRPPRDPVNALLSFGYTLLYNDLRAILAAHGLDVRIGFLHNAQSNRPALAMDLIEEFRAPVIERMVLRVLNQKILRDDDFDLQNGSVPRCFLKQDSKKRFIEEYEQALHKVYLHQGSGLKLDIRRIISLQVICLKRAIRGKPQDYVPARLKYT